MDCPQRCPVPCMAVLSSGGTKCLEGSLPCVSYATLSTSPESCTGFQWGQPKCLFWHPGPCKQLGKERNPFKPGDSSAQLLLSVNQSQT